MKWLSRVSVLTFVFLTQMAFATPVVKLTGEFQFTPTVGHREPISGKDDVLFEDTAIAVINMKYDKPVYGKAELSSSEQWTQTVTPAWTSSQLHLVFKLQPPPPGLPKTRSGKIMRRILRKIAEGKSGELGDTSTLADPSVVEKLVSGTKT
jgi:hypothetical protein